MIKLLFDASSLIRALKESTIDLLRKNYTQWLTVYEILNALWKETYINILEPTGLEKEILELAISRGASTYDASYVALAKKHGLTLVSEDQKLRERYRDLIKIINLDEIF
ncbi:MAG: type II toxin-antitoxin system VapC family toxin [Sulfolobales archaeon]